MDKPDRQAPLADGPMLEALPAHEARVGDDMRIQRALPNRLRRRVGAWCFLDHYGPVTVGPADRGMRVGPHPHTGLQTVSWLYQGEVLHRDSLGSMQLIRPGQLNLMTAGHGISHSEESPKPHPAILHGLQFWIALPEKARRGDATFDHHPQLPTVYREGYAGTVVIGTGLGEQSPARIYSPLVGVDLEFLDSGRRVLPLDPGFEHALLLIAGEATLAETPMAPATLYYLGSGRSGISIVNTAPARAFLLGGRPMGEEVLLWWNFVARSHEEMAAARADWESHAARFGEVEGYDGPRLTAPEITGHLKAS
jgi:redox-sensitive bicupin YhaK (pirin superfamily)